MKVNKSPPENGPCNPVDGSDTIRVLLVEDSKQDANATARALSSSDIQFNVTRCIRAEEALEKLETSEPMFDVVVSSLQLPGMHGLDFCMKLSGNAAAQASVILTDSGSEDLAVTALEAGVDGYVIKDPEGNFTRILPIVIQQAIERFRDRLERKKMERALKESEARLKGIEGQVQESIIEVDVNADGDPFIRNCSEATCRLYGYSRAELNGKPLYEIESEWSRDELRQIAVKSLTGDIGPFETVRIRKDGSRFPLEVTGQRKYTENEKPFYVFTERDITDRKRVEQIQAEEDNIRSTLIEALPYPTMLIRTDRTVVFANKVAREVGAVVGGQCWRDFGQCQYIPDSDQATINQHGEMAPGWTHCTFCMADDAMRRGETVVEPAIYAFERIWETYWIPVSGDIYLHFALDVTERKQSEDALHESKENLSALLNATPELAMLLEPDGTIINANESVSRRFGIALEELIGQNLINLLPPGVAESWLPVLQKFFRNKKPLRYVDENRGTWFDNSLYPILDGDGDVRLIAMYADDITEKRLAEEAAREEELKFRTLFEETKNPIFMANEKGEYINANKAALDFLEIDLEDLLEKSVWDHSPVEKPEQHQNGYSPFSGARVTEMNYQVGDVVKTALLNIVPISMNKENLLFGIGVDISELKNAQKTIATSLKEKEVLLREIHHRVKNNMQTIVSLLRMHSRRTDDDGLRQVFNDCRNRINAMSLIHEALYESLNVGQIGLSGYLTNLCETLRHAYGPSEHRVDVITETTTTHLGIDQCVAIGMVVSELISNVFKHAFPGVEQGLIRIDLSGSDQEVVELTVQDDGIGLPAEIDIYNPLSLGLALVVAIVTGELGGSIEVDREGGTRYSIRFSRST